MQLVDLADAPQTLSKAGSQTQFPKLTNQYT
jgi:hypothetical protein